MRRFRELALTGLVLGGTACSEPNGSTGLIGIQAEPAVGDDGSLVLATIRNLPATVCDTVRAPTASSSPGLMAPGARHQAADPASGT